MEAIYWIFSMMSILAIACIFIGLWIAANFLPIFLDWIRPKDQWDLLSQPLSKIILWLTLGGLFTLPLLDIVRWIGNLVNIVSIAMGQTDSGFTTFLGLIPYRFYNGFYLILMLSIYGIVIWFANDYLSASGQTNRLMRIFIVLSIASLFYHGVSNIFTYIFAFQLPAGFIQQNYGLMGFLLEVVVGIVILLLFLFGLNRVLPTHPISKMHSKY